MSMAFNIRRILMTMAILPIIGIPALMGGSASAAPVGEELIPAYIYPSGTGATIWHHLCDTANTGSGLSTIIANPATGPGTVTDSNYVSVMSYCSSDKVNVVGYVPLGSCGATCTFGTRSETAAKADIDKWVTLYGSHVEGIFFDLVNSDSAANTCGGNGTNCKTYAGDLVAYTKSKIANAMVVGNTGGTAPNSDWPITMTHPFDIINIFEGYVSTFSTWTQPSWDTTSDENSVSVLVHQDPGTTHTATQDASAVCSRMQNHNVGVGVAWSDPAWSSDPTTVSGNGIWDDFLADGC